MACAESRAARLAEKARLLAREGNYQEAIAALRRVEGEFGTTSVAQDAQKQLLLYRGLLDAKLKEERRQAKDDLWALARGLFEYRERWKRYPARLAELDPGGSLPSLDPWGSDYLYRPSADGRGYRLQCLGSDGVPGGSGDDVDLVVINGEFVKDLPWEDR